MSINIKSPKRMMLTGAAAAALALAPIGATTALANPPPPCDETVAVDGCATAGPGGAQATVPGAGAIAGPGGASANVPGANAEAGPGRANFCVPNFCASAG